MMTAVRNTTLLSICLVLSACHSIRITEPDRTATEQLLLSTATDKAVRDIDLKELAGKRVFFDKTYFKSYDEGYAMGSIRELLAKNGALLVNDMESSDIVVEARSGALGIDSRDSLFGIPELAVPIPFAGQIQSPELAIYKAQHADSTARFALLAYETKSGEFVHATGSMVGKSKFYHYKILGFINWRVTNIPEQKPGS
ncbi:hypothetical protein N8642_02505 [bacterium]|jgi:hypothetical protein|nr:hypothetical protein [bacterium]